MSPQTQMQFTPGQPRTYIATRTFELGRTGLKIQKGMDLLYDGSLLTLPGYVPTAVPELRGAIKAGWVVPPENYDPDAIVRRVSAGVRMGPADGGNPMDPKPRHLVSTEQIENEEHEVGNTRTHAEATRNNNRSNYRREAATRVPVLDAFDQEGVVVRTLENKAVQNTNLEKVSPGEAIARAQSIQVRPGQGRSREEVLDSMDPFDREMYEAEIQARSQAHYSAPVVVGQVKVAADRQSEGFLVRNTVGNGVATADLGGTGAQDQVTTTEVEGMKFTNTNGPRGKTGQGFKTVLVDIKKTEDVRRKIAKSMCPAFPDLYNFDDPERKKIARIQADFEDRPDVIRAIFAAENDAMKGRLVDEFPSVFG